MWAIPLLSAIGLAAVLLVAQRISIHFAGNRARKYRTSYINLIDRTEYAARKVNQMAPLAEKIKQPALLEVYEGLLNRFENLLTMFKTIRPFGKDPTIVNSAHFLLRDCLQRIKKLESYFQSEAKGNAVDLRKMGSLKAATIPTGCYFCSRPFFAAGFSKVKVRIEGKTQQVYSCDVCRDTLGSDKKVKVLYFMKDGKPLHWSEVEEYNPVKDYWDMNRKNTMFKPAKLELVKSLDD